MSKIAFVFAGQGAQKPGMGKELYEGFPEAKAVFDAVELKRPGTLSLCFEGEQEDLNLTINTQPCLFAVDLACARALESMGVFAEGAAGFSLGEIPALAYCGLLSEADALELVMTRAAAMHQAGNQSQGEMYAVLKLLDTEVEAICKTIKDVWPVNYNFSRQTVVACTAQAGPELVEKLTAAGGDCRKLRVSGAFHSPLMAPAAEAVKKKVSQLNFEAPEIPLYANATAKVYGSPAATKIPASTANPETLAFAYNPESPASSDNPADLIVEQITHPVQWKKTIENMISDGFDTFIEVGAGRALSGLIRKINPEVKTFNVSDMMTLQSTVTEVTSGK